MAKNKKTFLEKSRWFCWGYILLLLAMHLPSLGQNIGIGATNPHASAALEIRATNRGLLIPRMTTAQRNAIASPANGLMVYDTDQASIWIKQAGQWVELENSIALKSVNGSTTFSAVPLNPKRYIWELDGTHPWQNTIAIPQNLVEDLCGDDDGCQVSIIMANWEAGGAATANNTLSFKFSYNIANKKWRVNDGSVYTGTDGNSLAETIGVLNNNIFFTDGVYAGSTGTDSATGLGFMKWTAFPITTIGRLIMED